MEEVEEANKAAVESCHRVLSLLSQPQDQVQYKNLMVETGEAVFRFKKVVSLLNNGSGHARVRKLRKLPNPVNQSIFLENPHHKTEIPSKNLQFLQSSFHDNPVQEMGSLAKSSLTLGNPSLELISNGKQHLQLGQQTPSTSAHYHFLQQQQLQQRLLHQQQQQQHHHMKLQAEKMFRKSNSGVSLNFDSSSCTPTMSSNRSFISSLSMDGSVANLDGSAFHLIGAPRSSDQSSQQHKRKCSGRGEDGSVKCGSNGRCHCSKKRLGYFFIIIFFFLLFVACLTPLPPFLFFSFLFAYWLLIDRKHRVKKSIKVPAISNKLADIPPDDYSWRKYGQKPIKGSPHPRYIQFAVFDMRLICKYCVEVSL